MKYLNYFLFLVFQATMALDAVAGVEAVAVALYTFVDGLWAEDRSSRPLQVLAGKFKFSAENLNFDGNFNPNLAVRVCKRCACLML